MIRGETCPCSTCGQQTDATSIKKCAYCWEVESRLHGYLLRGGAKARAFVLEELRSTEGKEAPRGDLT